MELSTLSLDELKARAYDQLVTKEHAEQNLRIINQEIYERLNDSKNPPSDEGTADVNESTGFSQQQRKRSKAA